MSSSSSASSKTPSEKGDDVKGFSSSSPVSSGSSSATTPEPSSPTVAAAKHASVDPFQPHTEYNDKILPAIPASESVQPLATDSNTPDHWIARDERMIRLTGKHPCNVEAPLSELFSKGFLTPQNLFYVRSHGDTPRVTRQQADNWKLKIHGLVEREVELSIKDLKEKFPTVTLPITLVCAGNRRKEQNMVAKGLGFNWGAAGVSTGLFTGVYLADILDYCKPKNPLLSSFPSYDVAVPGRARHVVFEGADELPKGKYGTSQRLNWALDRSKGMIIAWGLNGQDLSPDHGYPLRLVVPGQIGGRMVKWLERIQVSDRESQHHLHFHDNKVLPTEVTADQARSEMHWWHDPKYIINDLNVNAAICSPDHDQVVDVSADTSSAQMLPIQGYAYTGGGRRIHRVEISLDDGHSWKCAQIHYPEDLYRMYPIHGHPYFGTLDLSCTEMSFAWCFWRLDVDMQADMIAKDVKVISVRALDEGLATMPRDMYWNATSMMNSWWFRVAVHREGEDGASKIRFEHPTLAGNAPGGWMQRMNEAGLNPRYPQFGDAKAGTASSKQATGAQVKGGDAQEDVKAIMIDPAKAERVVSAADLAAHADGEGPEPWFVVHGHVYDGTGFLKDHPGGDQSIRLVAGDDATEDFMAIHSMDAKKMLRDYHLGRLETQAAAPPTATTQAAVLDLTKPFLDPKKWRATRLVSKKVISPDVRIFRFALGGEDQELGLPVGQHVFLRIRRKNALTGETETVQRAYTPYSGNAQRGTLDILIKLYFPIAASAGQPTPAFAGGKMTMLLDSIAPSSPPDDVSIELKGPLGHFTYLGEQQIEWKPLHTPRRVRKLAMIAGGSGITPIWSTLKAIADEALSASAPKEPIQIWIVYGNRTEEDILIRDELERLRVALSGNLHIWHVLSNVLPDHASGWTMGRGHITAECMREHLPPPPPKPKTEDELEDTLALVCGPPPMERAVRANLESLGWDLERTVVFF